MRLSFVWWNTALSPTVKKDRATVTQRVVAAQLIEMMATALDADVICLGEVSEKDIASMRSDWEAQGFAIREGVSRAGRSYFDTCVLYRKSKLFVLEDTDLTAEKGASTLKVGQRIDFGLCDNETVLHLFVSHWPSQQWCYENHADRHLLGVRLRDAIDAVGLSSGKAHVIVLGDFNDEPFAKSLSAQLMATRDRYLAAKKAHLLYNPFWRHMGEELPYTSEHIGRQYGGSYYYAGDVIDKWRTFDQIMFSSSFLGKTEWHLREDLVRILDVRDYTNFVLEEEHNFDHLPVVGVIEKKAAQHD
ncbi:endonuclease/exonuclease/phosphatase family protein [Burkholderia cepacia]|uniref:endonuclease/exonuclease/phosphatase family protein n=1 Tax=Burkholderia cepacia TaxID=292 RepID=UPI003D66CE35